MATAVIVGWLASPRGCRRTVIDAPVPKKPSSDENHEISTSSPSASIAVALSGTEAPKRPSFGSYVAWYRIADAGEEMTTVGGELLPAGALLVVGA